MDRKTRTRLDALLGAFPGASYTVEQGRKHCKVRLKYNGVERFVTKSLTPGCPHAEQNFLADVRRTLKGL